MSKNNLEKVLRNELGALNNAIDWKIIQGRSYAQEARRHKYVVSTLRNIRKSQMGWFGRALVSII